jgi:hypothetical protein
MFVFWLWRRLSRRGQAVLGLVLMAVGMVEIAVLGRAIGLLVHGAAVILTGAIVCASVVVRGRRGRPPRRLDAEDEPVPAVSADGP